MRKEETEKEVRRKGKNKKRKQKDRHLFLLYNGTIALQDLVELESHYSSTITAMVSLKAIHDGKISRGKNEKGWDMCLVPRVSPHIPYQLDRKSKLDCKSKGGQTSTLPFQGPSPPWGCSCLLDVQMQIYRHTFLLRGSR